MPGMACAERPRDGLAACRRSATLLLIPVARIQLTILHSVQVTGLYLLRFAAACITTKNRGKPRFFYAEQRLLLLTFHGVKEFVVGLGHGQLVDEELNAVNLTHGVHDFAQDPHLL